MLPDPRRVLLLLLMLSVAYSLVPGRAAAQRANAPGNAPASTPPAGASDAAAAGAADGTSLRIYLMTVEPGEQIWEKFGHDAIWVIDTRSGEQLSYNYGIFDFAQPNFVPNFLRGRMLYSMGDAPRAPDAELQYYASYNRSVIVQELNLSAAQKAGLRDFLAWNNLPENSSYRYDYFRDNCATRIRDAIDRATGGQLRAALTARDAGTTYRWQARRMLADEPLAYTGVELGLANPVDHPLNAWDDSFLPMRLMEHVRRVQVRQADGTLAPLVTDERFLFQSDRAAPPAEPPNRTIAHVIVGLLVGGVLLVLGRLAARRGGIARFGFAALGFLWSFTAGFFGLVIMLLWAVTDHSATYWNENVLQASVLSLALSVLLVMAAFGRARGSAWIVACLAAGLSVLGFIVQVLPGPDQFNGEIIGLFLPAHLGLLAAIGYFYRNKMSPAGDASSL